MNYEELFDATQIIIKELTDKIKTQKKLSASVKKSLDSGDLRSCARDLSTLTQAGEEHCDTLYRLRELIDGFDAKEYIANGDYVEQLLDQCASIGLDVKGDFPVYEIFPYRVRIDAENQDLYVDRKKSQRLRPQSFARDLKASKDKLMKVAFNAAAFAGELAEAYDIALMRQSNGKSYAKDADCYLSVLYQYLTPMSRHRREYDKQSYAFDLARLYNSDTAEIKGGRRFQFGPARNNAKAIRILDAEGTERFLTTVRFY